MDSLDTDIPYTKRTALHTLVTMYTLKIYYTVEVIHGNGPFTQLAPLAVLEKKLMLSRGRRKQKFINVAIVPAGFSIRDIGKAGFSNTQVYM